jgi:hypothetical protein
MSYPYPFKQVPLFEGYVLLNNDHDEIIDCMGCIYKTRIICILQKCRFP